MLFSYSAPSGDREVGAEERAKGGWGWGGGRGLSVERAKSQMA